MKKSLQRISPWFWGILLAAVSLAACQKSDPEMDTISQQSNPDIKFISSLGYDVSGIEKVDDGYLVEGDIWLTNQWLADAKKQPQTRLTNCQGGNLVSEQYRNKLFLNISSICSGSNMFFWDIPLADAMNEWNKIDREKCYIKISNTQTGNLSEIKITFEDKSKFNNNLNKLMKVTPPSSDGTPGSVMINKECKLFPKVEPVSDGTTMNHAKYLVMHAIGHALGLGHTLPIERGDINDKEDWGENIPATQALDSKSIMQKEKDPLPWTGFSSIDKVAIPLAFPIPALAPGTINAKKVLGRNDNVLNIDSEKEASTAKGTITYQWEQNLGGKWQIMPGQTGKDLVGASLPKVLQSQYQRKAISGDKSDYSNTCYVEYEPFDPGSIEKEMLIETKNPNDQLTIAVKQSAWCPLGPTTYVWESKTLQSTTWIVIPDAKDPNLKINAPLEPAVQYKRKAICSHREHDANRYSNECIVYNKAYISAGKLQDLVEINKTGFDTNYEIPSEEAPSLPNWTLEINEGVGWTVPQKSEYEENPYREHITKFRRKILLPDGSIITSNECTVINYALYEAPRSGNNFGTAVQLGSYNSDFTKTAAIDTRGKYFRDTDRLNLGGNDAFFEFEITKTLDVSILTGTRRMCVWLDIWCENNSNPSGVYSGPLAEIYDISKYVPYPVVDQENQDSEWIRTFELTPGKYTIMLQGYKYYNSGCVNDIISISFWGTTGPPRPTEPQITTH